MAIEWCPCVIGWPCISAEAWAAWIQAIFSVLGIGVAIYVPAKQHKRDRDDRIREANEALLGEKQYARAIIHTFIHALEETGPKSTLPAALQNGEMLARYSRQLEPLVMKLSRPTEIDQAANALAMADAASSALISIGTGSTVDSNFDIQKYAKSAARNLGNVERKLDSEIYDLQMKLLKK